MVFGIILLILSEGSLINNPMGKTVDNYKSAVFPFQLNNQATLFWAANYGAIEFHVPFEVFDEHHSKNPNGKIMLQEEIQ
jgi:hypothetical protein